MDYSENVLREIQQLISGLCGETVSTEQAIETYAEMMDLDDISESFCYVYK